MLVASFPRAEAESIVAGLVDASQRDWGPSKGHTHPQWLLIVADGLEVIGRAWVEFCEPDPARYDQIPFPWSWWFSRVERLPVRPWRSDSVLGLAIIPDL